jgi:hypothetical protein
MASKGGQIGLLWAASLVVGGLLLLLYNFGWLTQYQSVLQYGLPGLALLVSLGFFAGYLANRSHWWRLIPAWTLVALAGMIFLSSLEAVDQRMPASLLFLAQAVAFVHVYLLNRREHWWAWIPGGFMLVIGGVIGLSLWTEDINALGGLLSAGLGGVFLLLYLMGEGRRLWWALIPATVLIIFGIFLLLGGPQNENLSLRWWPLSLVGIGLLMGWLSLRRQPRQKLTVNQAPKMARSAAKGEKSPGDDRPALGQYRQPAPGATIDLLPDPDEK